MCGRNSKWLGPKRRHQEFGSPNGGAPRHGGNARGERKGWRQGARVR